MPTTTAPQQTAPATPHRVEQALVIKDEDLFFLCERNGDVPVDKNHGLGLYYHDCRYLNGYELRLAGHKPEPLADSDGDGYQAVLQLTNPFIGNNGASIQRQAIGLRWERLIDEKRLRLIDRVTLHNYTGETVDLPLNLSFRAAFEDMFVVRGVRSHEHRPTVFSWTDDTLNFSYLGEDHLARTTAIRFSLPIEHGEDPSAIVPLRLGPQEEQRLEVDIRIVEGAAPESRHVPAFDDIHQQCRSRAECWAREGTTVTSSHAGLDAMIRQSFSDMRTLRSRLDGLEFFAAGVPWYVTLFGRDSLIACIETLAYEPHTAEQTLRLLARMQGHEHNAARAEEPGKILHELRIGELARAHKIPFTPYYGTVDATPLFLILLGVASKWTGDLNLFKELRPNVESALQWMFDYGALRNDGYLVYGQKAGQALANQGWKDSTDAISNDDGTLAEPPIALAEVQGYAYFALQVTADLFGRSGDAAQADHLRGQAQSLRERFNNDFWLDDLGIYAMALQKNGRPTRVVGSNAGQVLWSGIATDERARRVIRRLMKEDMFCGWGIRTLSSSEKRYSPIEYHLGTVWPHDNAIIAAGFRRYGDFTAVSRIFMGLLEAGEDFEHHRLPEVFAGFGREEIGKPVRYPTACHPQAWAAGSIPYFLQSLLGLEPEGFEGRLRIRHPQLPREIEWLELRRLQVGQARADLRFEQARTGKLAVTILHLHGHLDVVIDE